MLADNWEAGLADWRRAFRHGPEVRQTIIEAVASQLGPDVFLAIFEPDRQGLETLFRYYREADQKPQAQAAGRRYVEVLEQYAHTLRGAEATRYWEAVQETYGYLEMFPEAAVAARQAVRTRPGDFRLHYLLGVRLWQSQQWDEALQQFRWCLNRRPGDPLVQRKVAETKRDMRSRHTGARQRTRPSTAESTERIVVRIQAAARRSLGTGCGVAHPCWRSSRMYSCRNAFQIRAG